MFPQVYKEELRNASKGTSDVINIVSVSGGRKFLCNEELFCFFFAFYSLTNDWREVLWIKTVFYPFRFVSRRPNVRRVCITWRNEMLDRVAGASVCNAMK